MSASKLVELGAAKQELARLLRENTALRERLEKHGEFPEHPLAGKPDNFFEFASKIVTLAARGDRYLRMYIRALRTMDSMRSERATLILENGRLRTAVNEMINSKAFSSERLRDIFESVMKTGAPF
jgi:regulator of replication initiation timing